ncbi:MAG: hypothetical protein VKJ46_01680 [Leptolyngbyaceae bacterium]|nr:hypothetical protein [Leptolyngbyaceae bacterium]
MGIQFKRLVSGLAFTLSATIFASATLAPISASAQEEMPAVEVMSLETVPEVFDRVMTLNSTDFFANRSTKRQTDFILGLGSFSQDSYPENELVRDARNLNKVYADVLQQQVSSTPIIRTPDLNNPFDTSLLMLPSSRLGSQVVGSELVFERAATP